METVSETPISDDRDVLASPKTQPKQLSETYESFALPPNQPPNSPQPGSTANGPNGRDYALSHTTDTNTNNIQKRLEFVKTWSLNTLKCTKQVIEEKLGTAVPTTDEKLDLRIECLRQMQRQYRVLLDGVRMFTLQFSKTMDSQRQLSIHLAYMSQQQLELAAEFNYNAATQRVVADNGQKLIDALQVFCSALSTLIDHTFADTLLTVKHMNSARVEYDAHRKDAELARAQLMTSPQDGTSPNRKATTACARFEACQQAWNQLKAAVDTKIHLLHENRIRVMQHQLLLLHNATSAYFSGNNQKLEQTLSQFNVKSRCSQSQGPTSWLEQPSSCPLATSSSDGGGRGGELGTQNGEELVVNGSNSSHS